jgi:hypothetical protein
MFETKSLAHLGIKLDKYATNVNNETKNAVVDIARDVKVFTMVRLGSPMGRAVRLRNVGKKGARVGVSYDVQQYPTNTVAIVKAFGPMHLVENKIEPHPIPQVEKTRRIKNESGNYTMKREKTGKLTRDQGKRFLALPKVMAHEGHNKASNVRLGPIMHPGVKRPKKPFRTGVELANKAAEKRVERRLNRAMYGSF